MTAHYIVTDKDGELRREYPDSGAGWAMDAEDAAEMWAKEQWPHLEWPDEIECFVTLPGTTTPMRYTVTVEQVPSFSAHKAGA